MDSKPFADYVADDTTYFGAQDVVAAELKYIRQRRGLADDAPVDHLSGLALSGGGIRSASFSLGILQALAHNGWLKNIDYLSTVSGGGYIGSSLSWLLAQQLDPATTGTSRFGVERDNFPYGSYPMSGTHSEARLMEQKDEAESAAGGEAAGITERYKGKLLRFLRQQAKYLTPGDGINTLSLVAVILRGTLLSLFVYFGLLFLAFGVLGYPLLTHTPAEFGVTLPLAHRNLALWLALAGGVLFVLLALGYSLATFWLSKRKRATAATPPGEKQGGAYHLRQSYERWAGRLLTASLVLLILGAVPEVYDALQQWTAGNIGSTGAFEINGTRAGNGVMQITGIINTPASASSAEQPHGLAAWIGAFSTLFGTLSGIFAFFKSGSTKKSRLPMGLLVAVGSAALWFGLLLIAYHVATWLWGSYSGDSLLAIWVGATLAIGLVGWFANINYISIHRYYRDRLMEAFMPDVDKALAGEIATRAAAAADKAPIATLLGETSASGLAHNPAPYHLINTNVVLEASTIPKFRGRGGDNFILSPHYCGSNATGWSRSDTFMNGRMTLPTAMAISGAAVNPSAGVGGQGVTRQPLLSMLMGLLNIRLGYWAPNPRPAKAAKTIPNYFHPGLCEMFARWRLNEDAGYVQLTDGGHFENLALYELIRRRARLIIVCDGAADPDFQFSDLSNALEKIRTDFGALVLCDCENLQPLVPRSKNAADKADDVIKCAQRGYLMSTIIYPDNSQGRLLYIKTTFFEQLSADLYGYKKTHPQFPDEPTSDQFFDEKQFEAYRELGFQTAWRMMQDEDIRDDKFVLPLRR